jgi:phosphoribosylamine--glycine ligase
VGFTENAGLLLIFGDQNLPFMRVLLIGSGGREHTLAWKLSQSPLCEKLFVAPGNPGTAECGTNVELDASEHDVIADFIIKREISLLVIGPEAPLVNGLVDHLKSNPGTKSLKIIGPKKEGAKLEGSKAYAKKFMMNYNIPTAHYREFDDSEREEALEYIEKGQVPIVLKADGLAAGKGVLICNDKVEARKECTAMLEGKFGAASKKLVIEDFLDGDEFSVFILTNGKEYKVLPIAKDYKQVGEGDTGLNTGGMGSVSPVSFVDEEMMKKVDERIIQPTMKGLEEDDISYTGFMFLGLMAVNGDPYVIEYNCRMGDPESQVVFPRLENDLMELLRDCADHNLSSHTIKSTDEFALCTILASGGYPEAYEKGKAIAGIDEAQNENTIVFQAGTKLEEGILKTNGGRVLSIVGKGANFKAAKEASLNAVDKIHFDKKYFRSDIGFDLND